MSLYRIHTLCFDAPLVAVLGFVLVHRSEGRTVVFEHAILVFLTVWLAYVGDRWMDAQRNPLGALQSPRHWLFVAGPEKWFRIWLGVFLVNLLLSFWALDRASWFYGLSLGLASIGYAWMSQKRRWTGLHKELAVGSMFGWVAGGFTPWELTSTGVTGMLSIGAMCGLNSLWVSRNDSGLDALRAEFSAFNRKNGLLGERPAQRAWFGLGLFAVITAAWVSVFFAICCFAYIAAMFWLSRNATFSSHPWFSALADWGLLGVFMISIWLL